MVRYRAVLTKGLFNTVYNLGVLQRVANRSLWFNDVSHPYWIGLAELAVIMRVVGDHSKRKRPQSPGIARETFNLSTDFREPLLV